MQTPRAARTKLWAFLFASPMLVWLTMPAPAQAQQSPLTTWVGGPFSIVVVHPTVANDGMRIDCAPGTPGCKPLNLARCDDPTPLPISFVIGAGGSGTVNFTGQGQVLYAFLGTATGCIYSTISGQVGNNPNLLIGTTLSLAGSAPFFSGGRVPFRFPEGVSTFNAGVTQAGSTGVFTVGEMMQALGVCPPNAPVAMSTYRLCVGVDAGNTQGINNGTTANTTQTANTGAGGTTAASSNGQDPVAYLQFQIDTKPPAAPTIASLKDLNGRCELEVNYDTSSLDVYALKVLYTRDAQNFGLPCTAWTGDVGTASQNVFRQLTSTVKFMVRDLDNDVPYAFCAESTDYMENDSEPSQVAMGNPRFECDVFGCYPEDLTTGFCAQTAAPQLWLMTIAAWAWRQMQVAARARRQRHISRCAP